MGPFKSILVPTDFSECSREALHYGKLMAETFGAALHLLHVVQTPYLEAVGIAGLSTADLQKQWEQNARDELLRLMPDGDHAKLRTQFVTRVGHPATEILTYVREHDVDLIVMGTHGRGPVMHLLMGSVAEGVVRRASCPVLTVRAPRPAAERVHEEAPGDVASSPWVGVLEG